MMVDLIKAKNEKSLFIKEMEWEKTLGMGY
jgi:hypothetical protein